MVGLLVLSWYIQLIMIERLQAYLRQFERSLWVLCLGWFVGALGFAASIPFISIYFHKQLDLSMTQIGIFFGAMAIVRAIFQALGGELSDRMSRRNLLINTQIVRAFSFLSLGLAIYYHLGFWTIAVLMMIQSIFGAVYLPTINALVSDILPKEKRLDGYALTRSAGNLGWAAGPAIGGFMAHSSYAVLFYVSAAMTLASALVFLFAFKSPTQNRNKESFRISDLLAIKDDSNLAIHCVLSLVLFLVVAQLIAPFSVYTVDTTGISELQLGWLFTINGLLVGFTQLPVTRLLSRFRFTTQLAFGAMLYFIGYGALGLSGQYVYLILIIIIVSSGEMMMSPPSMMITSSLAPEGKIGRYMGIYGFFMVGGWSLGPLYGGWFLDHFSDQPQLAWLLIASLAVVAAVGYLWFGRRLPDTLNRK